MKSTKTKRYVVEKKFRERYTKIQLRSSSQRSTKLPFESGTSRAISAVAILLCLSFLVSLVLQYRSVRSCNRKGLQETKQQLLFHSNQDQLSSNLCVGVCVGGVSAPLSHLTKAYRPISISVSGPGSIQRRATFLFSSFFFFFLFIFSSFFPLPI